MLLNNFKNCMRLLIIVVISVMILGACGKPSTEYKSKANNPEFLHRTMKAITDRIVHDIFSPPVASRIYTYSSVAAYEAIIHDDKSYKSLAGQLHGVGFCS